MDRKKSHKQLNKTQGASSKKPEGGYKEIIKEITQLKKDLVRIKSKSNISLIGYNNKENKEAN